MVNINQSDPGRYLANCRHYGQVTIGSTVANSQRAY
jgi:hypothetical protein